VATVTNTRRASPLRDAALARVGEARLRNAVAAERLRPRQRSPEVLEELHRVVEADVKLPGPPRVKPIAEFEGLIWASGTSLRIGIESALAPELNIPICYFCIALPPHDNPYNSLAGMRAVIRALQPRVPPAETGRHWVA
jgi:hypothetical protein